MATKHWRMRPYGLRPRMSFAALGRGRRRTPEWFAERMAHWRWPRKAERREARAQILEDRRDL
jgi:hypothetical protein